jgi:S1-C subfamily serine protease
MNRKLAGIFLIGALSLGCTTVFLQSRAIPSSTAFTAVTNSPPGSDLSLADLYARVNPGVVAILAYSTDGKSGALGTGFVVDADGHIVTNFHVVQSAKDIEVDFPSGRMEYADVIALDPGSDLAVLSVDVPAGELHPLTLGDSSLVKVGDPVVAIGNPYGLYSSMTAGIVSAKGRADQSMEGTEDEGFYLMGDLIQTDAAVNPGNSGGPLLNMRGEVIGVNRSIVTEAVTQSGNVVNSGLGFAVSSNIVRRVLPFLIADGKFDYPYLGLAVLSELHLKAMELLELSSTYGVYVTKVIPGGPADLAGLRAGSEDIPGISNIKKGGDLILALNGETIHNSGEMVSYLVLNARPGDAVRFTVSRGGKSIDLDLTVGSRP